MKPKCERLIRKFGNRDFVLDDETYFTLSHSLVGGNDGFYTTDIFLASPKIKFATKAKFEAKVQVWIAMGLKGLSRLFIQKSGLYFENYLKECLQKRLISYIRKHYLDDGYVFWPDLASSHYARNVVEALRAENIEFVQKKDNSANCLETRFIEDFWAILKSNVYARGWKADNTEQLIRRIKYCLQHFNQDVVRNLAESTRERLDEIRRHGLVETRKFFF